MKLLRNLVVLSLLVVTALPSKALFAENFVELPDVGQFINEMVKKHKFQSNQLQQLFNDASIYPSILEAIARPAESKPWFEYRPIFLTEDRVAGGIKFWQQHAETLRKASDEYGVPEEIIVAIIGVETRYGRHTGRYPVFDALATLAFKYPPRSSFFRSELEQFLLMAREENIPARDLKGSYAGAMGMPQFIASSFRRYAVDFDKDGKRDLWNNPEDVIGSVANYFRKHHWKKGDPITHKVQVHGKRFHRLLSNSLKPQHSVQELLDGGVILPGNLQHDSLGRLIQLTHPGNHEYWVGWHNFYVITRYNHSALYSMAVYQLSQLIKQGYQQPGS